MMGGASMNTMGPVTKESYKTKLASMKAKKKIKPIGSRVQSPDMQYATGMMGKQPVPVFPLQGKWQKENL